MQYRVTIRCAGCHRDIAEFNEDTALPDWATVVDMTQAAIHDHRSLDADLRHDCPYIMREGD